MSTMAEVPSLDVLERYAEHSSAFLAYNDRTEHFVCDDAPGLIAYQSASRRHAIQLCGPFAPPTSRERLLTRFIEWAQQQGRRITAVQLNAADAALYARNGFIVNQLGSSYSIDLDHYALHGRRFVKTRNMIAHAHRRGIQVEEIAVGDPRRERIEEKLCEIDRSWLRDKGWHVRELAFMIGERGGRGRSHRRLFVANHHSRTVAYVTYAPVFGSRAGWLYDLTRRSPAAPPGTVEAIFHTAASRLRDEGHRWLHLGFTPFVGLAQEHERPSSSPLVRQLIQLIAARGAFIYPAHSQERFKRKWRPQVMDPEYIAFQGRPSIGAIWQLLRLTRAL